MKKLIALAIILSVLPAWATDWKLLIDTFQLKSGGTGNVTFADLTAATQNLVTASVTNGLQGGLTTTFSESDTNDFRLNGNELSITFKTNNSSTSGNATIVYNATNGIVLDGDANKLYDNNGVLSIDFAPGPYGARTLYDQFGARSIDWIQRRLHRTSADEMLDWSVQGLVNCGTNVIQGQFDATNIFGQLDVAQLPAVVLTNTPTISQVLVQGNNVGAGGRALGFGFTVLTNAGIAGMAILGTPPTINGASILTNGGSITASAVSSVVSNSFKLAASQETQNIYQVLTQGNNAGQVSITNAGAYQFYTGAQFGPSALGDSNQRAIMGYSDITRKLYDTNGVNYVDFSSLPYGVMVVRSAITNNTTDFASAAQGSKADAALTNNGSGYTIHITDAVTNNNPVTYQQALNMQSRGVGLYLHGAVTSTVIAGAYTMDSSVNASNSIQRTVNGVTNNQYIFTFVSPPMGLTEMQAGTYQINAQVLASGANSTAKWEGYIVRAGADWYESPNAEILAIPTTQSKVQWNIVLASNLVGLLPTDRWKIQMKAVNGAGRNISIWTEGTTPALLTGTPTSGAEVDPMSLHLDGGTMTSGAVVNMNTGYITNSLTPFGVELWRSGSSATNYVACRVDNAGAVLYISQSNSLNIVTNIMQVFP